MAAHVGVIILPLQWALRSFSKIICGEKSSSSLGTGFTTFAKCKENQPLFHAVTTSTDTLNYLRPEVYYGQTAGQDLTVERTPVANEGHCVRVASCFLSSTLLFHEGLKWFYQINTIWRAVKKVNVSVSRPFLLSRSVSSYRQLHKLQVTLLKLDAVD